MVLGHTFDALLAPSARGGPLIGLYWMARGFTAPLFMVVAGWALAVATSRRRERGLAVPRARLPRVLLLLALGYALRWPGWGVALLREGDAVVWAHFLAFDALHAIATAIVATTAVFALPWSGRAKAVALAALTAVAVALGVAPLSAPTPDVLPGSIPLLALAQAAGGTSTFPLFPWVGYFFAGAILGLLARGGHGWSALATAAAGAALAAAGPWNVDVPIGHPRLFAFRLGIVLVFLAALSIVPASVAARVRSIGRASLFVYVLHLPIVYGWSTHEGLIQRIGPRLPFGSALAAGAAVLVASLVLRHAIVRAVRGAATAAGWLRRRWSGAAVVRRAIGPIAGHAPRDRGGRAGPRWDDRPTRTPP